MAMRVLLLLTTDFDSCASTNKSARRRSEKCLQRLVIGLWALPRYVIVHIPEWKRGGEDLKIRSLSILKKGQNGARSPFNRPVCEIFSVSPKSYSVVEVTIPYLCTSIT
jgi:hypothetical protein